MRSTDVHSWPALANAPAAAWPAAQAGSTPSSTISGSLPPSSSSALRRSPAHAAASSRPVAIEPVWITRSTPGWAASGRPARSSPSSSSRTPAGRSSSSTRRIVESGVFSDGLRTTVLPVTRHAPSWPPAIAIGSFHGTSSAATPRGSCTMRSVAPRDRADLRAGGRVEDGDRLAGRGRRLRGGGRCGHAARLPRGSHRLSLVADEALEEAAGRAGLAQHRERHGDHEAGGAQEEPDDPCRAPADGERIALDLVPGAAAEEQVVEGRDGGEHALAGVGRGVGRAVGHGLRGRLATTVAGRFAEKRFSGSAAENQEARPLPCGLFQAVNPLPDPEELLGRTQ